MFSGYGQLVIGPAGNGKTTYCHIIQQFAQTKNRKMYLVNLDPASESTSDYDIDIKDLVSIDDVMSTLDYGPNGGLIYCLEYLLGNLSWLHDEIEQLGEGVYLLFDCPGQIELYSHLGIMKTIAEEIAKWGIHLCCVYCIDVVFLSDSNKYIAGSLISLSSMIQLELPYLNVLTKCDKFGDMEKLEELLETTHSELLEKEASKFSEKFHGLNKAIAKIIEDYSNFQVFPMNIKDEDSIEKVLFSADLLVQYGECEEPQDKMYEEAEQSMNNESYPTIC
eukprot:TRINITY_DN8618_c0_g1_i3.p1 TRINITY_DN8618_c0_g1~~TRINITY_DN8618_c0_g1_i3.p1  ORF type:complete len:278 (+),score=68.03 TRINITY_DN8618_c0_g1_i3:178-1011(+)